MKAVTRLSIIILLCSISIFSFSQGKAKFGHIDTQVLLESMPEREKAVNELQKYASELEETLTAMQKEFELKYTEYLAKSDSLSAFLKKNKEEELQLMNQRIEEFKIQANQDVQQKEAELVEPIFKKAKTAIQDVAKEQGLIYVFDIAEGGGGTIVLYHSEESTDILPLVKKKLAIQ